MASQASEPDVLTSEGHMSSVTSGPTMALTSRFSMMAVALQSLVVSGGVSDGEEDVEVEGSDTASAGGRGTPDTVTIENGDGHRLSESAVAVANEMLQSSLDVASIATKNGSQSGVEDGESIAMKSVDSHPNIEDTHSAASIPTKSNVGEQFSEIQNGSQTKGLLHNEGDVMNVSSELADQDHCSPTGSNDLTKAFDAINMQTVKEEYFTQKEIQSVISPGSSHVEVRQRVSGAAPGDQGEGTSTKEVGPFDDLWLPTDLPHILEIKRAIPKHCFESSVATSLYYMGKDFTIVAALYMATAWSWGNLPLIYQLVITPVFWLLQGTMFWAVFVVGHDGGHGSFSRHEALNDVIGNLCHTVILTPYYMWKLTHRNHHKNTGNMDKDDVFYPTREGHRSPVPEFPDFFVPAFGLGAGWFLFLTKGYAPRRVIHWNPWDSFFKNHVRECIISLGCLLTWLVVLNGIRSYIGVLGLLYYYVVPVFIFASYLVVVTFLQHSEMDVPWYSDHLWSNVRGQLSTVDRDYGWCHYLTHCIGTHQVHHLFPKIPHYNLMEATAAFRTAFPQLVNTHHDRILPAFWRMHIKFRDQHVCVDNTQVFLYKDT